MTTLGIERVKALLAAARDLAPDARAAFLDAECTGDDALRREVLSLLDAGERHAWFLDSSPDASPPSHVPECVGQFRVLGELGVGGMGAVYEAEQDHPRRRVALKMVRPGLITPDTLRRFRREAELLGRLHHPGIAQIYDAGMVDLGVGEQPWFAMELVDGRPLTRYADERSLDTRARLELFVGVCDAVQHAHERGVLHRDLKPDNILVVDQGSSSSGPGSVTAQPKVLDFGVGRATDADALAVTLSTSATQLVGTVPYMSPEQVGGGGHALDARSDVYALGVVLFELLTGRLPHEVRGQPVFEAARLIREEEPATLSSAAPDLRGDLDTIVAKALEKDPARRYASAAELATDVLRHLRDEPIRARPAGALEQLRKFARRNRVLVVGAAAVFVALALGLALALRFALDEAAQRALAERREAEARFATYRASVAAALVTSDPLTARAALARAPEELRGWEYGHLAARIDPIRYDYESGAPPQDGAVPGAVAWSPRAGPCYAFADAQGLHIVALESGRVSLVDAATTSPSCLALSEDARHLAAVRPVRGGGHELVVWRLDGGRPDAAPTGRHPLDTASKGLAIAPDGSRVAVQQGDGEVLVIDVAAGSVARRHVVPRMADGMAFTPDGESLLVGAPRSGLQRLGPDGVQLLVGTDGQFCLALDAQGARVAIPAQVGVQVRSAFPGGEGHLLGTRYTEPIAMAFSASGDQLACGTLRTIELWDLASGALAAVLASPEAGLPPGPGLRFGDGDRALLARTRSGARVWSLDAEATRVLRGHSNYVYEAVFSPDGTLLASAGAGNEVRLWDVASGEPLAVLPCELNVVSGLAFSADGAQLRATAGPVTYSWDVAVGAGSVVATPADPGLDDVTWSFSRHPEFWRAAAPGARLSSWRGAVQATATSLDGMVQVAGTPEGFEARRDPARGAALSSAPVDGEAPRGDVPAVAASAGGGLIATGHDDGALCLWDGVTGARLVALSGHTGRIYSLDFSPDGRRLASGSRDGTLRLWDLEHRQELLALPGHDDYVHSVRFSPDGTLIATSSGDGTVRLWDGLAPAERHRARRADAAMKADVTPFVAALLDELGDPSAVAARLRTDTALDEARRSAALRVLLARCRP